MDMTKSIDNNSSIEGSNFDSFISSSPQTQSAWKSAKMVGFSSLVSASFLALFIPSVLAGGRLSPTSSAPVISQAKTVENIPIFIGKNRSLPSSPILLSQAMGGALQVSNGTNSDAYVKLVEPLSRQLVGAFYVKSNSTFSLEQIPDGTYKVLFVLGNGWNPGTQSFTKNKHFAKFDKSLNFTTRQVSNGIQYSIFKITLHPVADGNASTSRVNEQEFDSY
jgi:hypothetical protein